MKNFSFFKILILDTIFSLFISFLLFFILKNFFYVRFDISFFISSSIFVLFFILSIFLSFFIFKLKVKIDSLNFEIDKLSKFDEVTNIYKRLYFFEISKKYFEISKRQDLPLSVMVIDIDNFKEINRKFGHKVGDEVLKKIANNLKKELRKSDVLGRFGGDEFIIIGFSNKDDLYNFAKRVKNKLSNIKIEDNNLNIMLSIGIAQKSIYDKLSDIIKKAEEALILAKQKGGNRVDYLEHFLLFE